MATKSKEKKIRVGMLVAVTFVVLMIFVFLIGSEQKIFSRKNEYKVRLDNVTGLAEGNPVKISGVTVGVIKDITLPFDPKMHDVDIELMVDKKYAERIRSDSRARLKKLGLLGGDSYIDISPGSPKFDSVEPGSLIPAARQTNVDQLISSGEDLVDNFVQISYSLKNVLGRVDRGEGLIGELTSTPETKQRITDTFLTTLNKTNAILGHVESGKGLVGKLVYDDTFAAQFTGSLQESAQSLKSLVANVEGSLKTGQGAIPALLNDPEGKKKVYDLVDNLRVTSGNLAALTASYQSGQGLVPRLMNDKAYADQALTEFNGLLKQLNDTVAKVNRGEGTAGKLISDPSVYESVNDILIGINESKLLRWLIRNRQQSGIQKRYDTESAKPPAAAPPPTTVPPPPVKPAPAPKSEAAPPDVPAVAPTTTATTTTTTTSTAPPP
ncbi:MAG: phospholipid/cholesterol/gamma-HCH transport system substrate-binding protein [Thermoanaerobaculia bacterium]|jgi:phospholipid/cholesterol/gamma-HCH transport system substrate-binding protein|nr:phospholipid/cholesterol/gamma-HCH transport system substrate-binding protein [Thermoanaerobaculia bacterium]